MKQFSRVAGLLALTISAPAALSLAALAQTATKPNLQAVDGAALKKAIDSHRGKVVLVNLWATWCAPCVEEFPYLVKLQNEFRAKGLVVVGVSMDEPRDGEKVIAFLEKEKAEFPVYIRDGGSIDRFFDPVDKRWTGAVPTTYLFGRDGKLVGKPITGSRTYEQFVALVEPLLK